MSRHDAPMGTVMLQGGHPPAFAGSKRGIITAWWGKTALRAAFFICEGEAYG